MAYDQSRLGQSAARRRSIRPSASDGLPSQGQSSTSDTGLTEEKLSFAGRRDVGGASSQDTLVVPGVARTLSGLEEARDTPRKKPSLVSSLMNRSRRDSDSIQDKDSVRKGKLGFKRPSFPSLPVDRLISEHGRQVSGPSAEDEKMSDVKGSFYKGGKLRPLVLGKAQQKATITQNVQDLDRRRDFILRLAKALLAFGSPSHRIESQLTSASEILDARAAFVHIPNIIIVTFDNEGSNTAETHFVRANGRIALTPLQDVHNIYRKVLHDEMGVQAGTNALRKILHAPPIYSLAVRCLLAFVCASVICVLAFGGSVIDMGISGACASVLQYLGLNAATKSAMYANVYEISVSIIVSFVARALGTIPGGLFCYNAISSAGVVLILPGFTILISSLELTSRNILCGSVRMVYAIIYTLFLGFGLTIGSDLYLLVNPHARHELQRAATPKYTYYHGHFAANNGSWTIPHGSTFGFANASTDQAYNQKGCYREPDWPWYRQEVPWWTLFFLVPVYSACSSLSNLQSWRSWQLLVMVAFSCAAYIANKFSNDYLPNRGDIVSAAGALVIGTLGNVYSRVVRGTAFTSMVTGVLFLVPSGIAQGGGLIATYQSSAQQYSTGFSLALRMIEVAIGVTVGLFVSQIVVYAAGRRKNAAHFAF